jgi:hypothetical protein
MAVAIESRQASVIAYPKLLAIGDILQFGFFAFEKGQATFDGEVSMKNGKPVYQEEVYGLSTARTTMKRKVGGTKDAPEYGPIDVDSIVRFDLSKFNLHLMIEACKTLPAVPGVKAGQRASGDIVIVIARGRSRELEPGKRQQFTSEDEVRAFRLNCVERGVDVPKLGWDLEIQVRRAKPEESTLEAMCDAAALSVAKIGLEQTLRDMSSGAPAGNQNYGDDTDTF